MDIAFFLDKRLEFVEYFYASTTITFGEIQRKIEAGEEPYDNHTRNYDTDEPAFQEEWESASNALTVAGATCLELLASTFQAFLETYVEEIGQGHVVPRIRHMGEKGWLANYRAFFKQHLQIDWAASGADLGLLEQVVLTRNDFTHSVDLFTLQAFQTPYHLKKYPVSSFVDSKRQQYVGVKNPLHVPRETLEAALAAVRTLGYYLEDERYPLVQRWRSERQQ